jgi:hypothetical protein
VAPLVNSRWYRVLVNTGISNIVPDVEGNLKVTPDNYPDTGGLERDPLGDLATFLGPGDELPCQRDRAQVSAELRNVCDNLGNRVLKTAVALNGAARHAAYAQTDYDQKGNPRRQFLPWFTNQSPSTFSLASPPPSASKATVFDAFGRTIRTIDFDGATEAEKHHHALSSDIWDRADLAKSSTAMSYDVKQRLKRATTSRDAPPIWSQVGKGMFRRGPVRAPRCGGCSRTRSSSTTRSAIRRTSSTTGILRSGRRAPSPCAGAWSQPVPVDVDSIPARGEQDGWVSPFAAEDSGSSSDPRRGLPSPHVAFEKRSREQGYTGRSTLGRRRSAPSSAGAQ